eukprot:3510068-Karenia_brevis.AAC.1
MPEKEDTEEDKAMQDMNRDLLGEELHDTKRKEEAAKEESPDTKRRRTQEDEDLNGDFWNSTEVVSMDIDAVEREIIESR